MPPQPSTQRPRADFADIAIALACGLAITSTALFLGVIPLIRSLAGSRDFIVYWATGQQLVHHADPYDPHLLGILEHSAGLTRAGTFYMRNPPWSLPFTLPLGFLPARVASLPWSLLLLALFILSIRELVKMFGLSGNRLEILGYCFPPALICVIMGQTSMFLLVGLVGFLRLHRSRPFWAGACLWLCTFKPHVFVPFGLVLLVWIFVTRTYRVLAGGLAAMAASCLVTEWLDPHAFGQYLYWARHSGITGEFIPCLSVELRNLIDPRAEWIAFVPCILGGLWALAWYWPRRRNWDWIEHGNVLMLVSVVVAPYCWIYDQSVALPALLFAISLAPSRRMMAILALLFLGVEIMTYTVFWEFHAIFLWPGPAWLIWYLFARRSARRAADSQPLMTAEASA